MNLFDNAPEELKQRKRWMLWNKNAQGSKIPIRLGGEPGSSTDPKCWCSHEFAVQSAIYYQGIAFVIDDPYTGIDLDNCNDQDGNIRSWALPILCKLDGVAYAEISPSGNGIKLPTSARKKITRCVKKFGLNKQQMEVYDHSRFWTITGGVWAGCREIGDGQAVVDWICDTYLSDGDEEKTGTVKHEPASVRMNFSSLMDRATAYLKSVKGESKGNLRNGAFSLAGHLHSLVDEYGGRLTDVEVLNLLRDWNQKNSDQLRDEELAEASRNGRTNGTPRADKLPIVKSAPIRAQPAVEPAVEPATKKPEKPKKSAAKATKERPKVDPGVFPIDCKTLPGFLGEVVRHNLATARYPLPELAVASAIALLSTLTGGKVSCLKTRTNLLIISLALSGAGKDHGRKLNRQILRLCGGEKMIGPERIGSHSGILAALAEQWNMLFQIDEIHHLAMAMQNVGANHLYQISSVLQMVFSSSDDTWVADALADRSRVKTLNFPHLTFSAPSTPSCLILRFIVLPMKVSDTTRIIPTKFQVIRTASRCPSIGGRVDY